MSWCVNVWMMLKNSWMSQLFDWYLQSQERKSSTCMLTSHLCFFLVMPGKRISHVGLLFVRSAWKSALVQNQCELLLKTISPWAFISAIVLKDCNTISNATPAFEGKFQLVLTWRMIKILSHLIKTDKIILNL